MSTYSAKPSDVTREWYVVDAGEIPLGRLATQVAALLMGKGKPQFTKHIDCGDFVVVTNAENLVVTGGKGTKKIYHHHTGYPGGIKSATLNEKQSKDPTFVVAHAVRGMMPDNRLRDERLKRLKVYGGTEHKHEAQKPKQISLKEGK